LLITILTIIMRNSAIRILVLMLPKLKIEPNEVYKMLVTGLKHSAR
jgi:hypothetical protein